MYYYILEQPKNKAISKTQEYLRDLLGLLGIAGEVVTVSPARSTDELVEMGLSKKYNTIVAVGSDRHINKIASQMINTKCVLGIIPINASSLINQLIGVSELKEAAEILKYRKLKEVNMGLIEPNRYFLTQAEIQSIKPIKTTITVIGTNFDSYSIETNITELIISRNIYVLLNDKSRGPGLIKGTWSWLTGKKVADIESSILRGKKIKIETSVQVPVIMDGEIIAKTPIVASLQTRVLKIITKPDRIVEEKK